MAERVLQATATITAGTAKASPLTVALTFGDWQIEAIELEVPPGPAGLMGFYLGNNGMQWLPRTPGEWLIWDDRHELIYPTGYPSAGGWQIVGYNTGHYDHVVIVRFHVNPVTGVARPAPTFALTFEERDVPAREIVTL